MIRVSVIAGSALALAACSSHRTSHLEGRAHTVDYVCAADGCAVVIKSSGAPLRVPVETYPAGADLAESPDGKVIAYRRHVGWTGDPGRWAAIRLRGGTRYLDDCTSLLGKTEPNFAALDPVSSAAMRILDCGKSAPEVWGEVARSIQEDSGSDAAAAFAIATSLREPTDAARMPPAYRDGWLTAFDALDAKAQATVRAEICPALHNSLTSPLQFLRALRRCPLDEAVPDALRWLHDGLAAPATDFVAARVTEASHAPERLNVSELALATAGSVALAARPKDAATIACAGLAKLSREGDPVRVAVAGSIIALSKQRCAALDEVSQLWPCDPGDPSRTGGGDVAKFAVPLGTPPVLASSNDAMLAALTIGGKLPPTYAATKADGGFVGGACP